MKKMYKAMLLVLCAILLVAGSVMGTLAYLKDTTGPITNTMSVGNVTITMDEADVDVYGNKLDEDLAIWTEGENLAARVTANDYKLIPGHEYTKDPTIHVGATSEDCWLFVKVVNGIKGMEADEDGVDTIAEQMEDNGWKALPGVANVYYHEDVAEAEDDVVVFEKFVIDGGADVVATTITITAYAVQEDGFGTAAAAWTAGGFGTTP